MFPVALVEEVIGAYAKAGDVLFEPFCGSGTQIIAAEKSATRCFAVELDPAYCDVAVRRFQNFSGEDAVLEQNGQTFDEIARERRQ